MSFVDVLTITNATSEGLIVANQTAVAEASARQVNVNVGGILKDSVVSSGGEVRAMQNGHNGFVSGLDIYDKGSLLIRSATNSGANIRIHSGGLANIQNDGTITGIEVFSGGEMRQYTGKLNALTIHSGGSATFNTFGQGVMTYNGLNVEAGAKFTTYTGFIMTGNVNIATGTWTNDTDAHAVNGTIYDLNLGINATFGSGITLNNFTQTGGTINVTVDAAIAGANLNAGTLNIAAGADVDGLTYNGGTFAISSGVTIKNFYKVGAGNINLYNDAVVDGGILYTGQLQALNNNGVSRGTIKNYTVSGGIMIVRGAGNLAENIAVSNGGILAVQSGASVKNVEVFGGGNIQAANHARGAQVTGLTLHDSATATFVADATLPVNIGNLVMEAGAKMTLTSAKISGAAVTGGELTFNGNANYISGGGTLNDLTIKGTGQLWINDPYDATSGGGAYQQMVNSNMTVDSGASVFLHGTNIYGSDAQISGTYYVQNGATLSGGDVYSGGYVNMWARENYNDSDIHAKAVGITIHSGGTAAATGADFYDITAETGACFALNNNAVLGGAENTIATGALYVDGAFDVDAYTDENHVLRNVNISAQTLYFKDGVKLADLSIGHAGRIYTYDTTIDGLYIDAPSQTTGGRANLSSGTVVNNARFNGRDKVTLVNMNGNAIVNSAHVSGGSIFLSSGGTMTDLDLQGGAVILRGSQAYVNGAVVYGGNIYGQNGAVIENVTVAGGGLSAYDTNMTNPPGKDEVVNNVTMTAGRVYVGSGATLTNLNATGGVVEVAKSGVLNVSATNVLNNIKTVAGARVNFVEHANGVMLQGDSTNIAASTFYYNGATQALGFTVTNGVVTNLGADGKTYRLSVGDDIVVNDAVVTDNCRISGFGGAVLNRLSISGKNAAASVVLTENAKSYDAVLTGSNGKTTLLAISANVVAYDTIVNSGGTLRFNGDMATAVGTVVNSGGKLEYNTAMEGFGHIEDTTLKAGAILTLSDTADTGEKLTLDFTAGGSSLTINNLGLVSSDTRIAAKGLAIGTTYTIATTGSTDRYVYCDAAGLYDNKVQGGTTYTNAFAGRTWNFSTGRSIAVTEFSIGAVKSTAGAITTADTALNTNDRAAKWDATTSYTDSVTLADSTLAGDAWLEIDGTNVSTALYGASGNYAHTVNIEAKSGEIRNLAAGAGNGGSVAGVKLTLDGADVTGAAYAGGFGTVTGKTETLISDGSFTKDFYAGALANYKSTGVQTTVGDIALTVAGGEFSGNIYGASAVKSSVAGAHAAGDVTLTITDGSTTKGTQSCIFAGGYATGTAAAATVYTVDSVTATISGGSWGTAAGGRGIFGGIMASGVTAQAGDVNLTVSGDATMGNIYGGGWAQKNGTSIVGDVDITIAGGTIANVFGGGSHSTSGGTTETGDVSITVSGGNITGAIYARGQLEGDITGVANVIFTGATDFGCDVFGYSYVGGAASDAALSFTGYTGEFSGNIGGFNGITFDGATAMELTTATADVSNGAWEFDLTDRADTLAGTSLLTWSGASFENDTIKVTFADDTQAQGGWNIAAVAEAFGGTTFEVEIGGTEIASGLNYSQQIADGDYAGWGFELESGVLKFKQLA